MGRNFIFLIHIYIRPIISFVTMHLNYAEASKG